MVFPLIIRMRFGWNFGTMPYGTAWRAHRRNFHQYLNSNAVKQYYPIMYEEIKVFLRKVKSRPADIFEHVQLYVAENPSELLFFI